MVKNLNPFRIILAVLITFIPLYPKFPLFNVESTYVAIRLDDIVMTICVLVWLIFQIKNKFPFFKEKITPLFIAYFIAVLVSTLNAVLIFKTTNNQLLLLNACRRFEYMSVFFITLEAVKKRRDFLYIYLFFIFTMLGVAAYGYGQKYFHFPVVSTMNEEFSKGQLLQMNIWTRISSTFAGHYDLAAYLSITLVITLALFIVIKNKWLKVSSLIVFLTGFHLLTLTASRISIFAFWGSVVLSLILLRKYLWIIPVSLLVVFSIFNSNDLKQRLIATIPSFKSVVRPSQVPSPPTPTLVPISTPATISQKPIQISPTVFRHPPVDDFIPVDSDVGVARSGEIRFNVEWPRAITAFRKNPITGTGLGSITMATDNDYLRSLGESGLFGFITFVTIFIYFLFKTWPLLKLKKFTFYHQLSLIFFSAMVCIWANAIFIDVFEASKVAYTIWIIMGLYYKNLEIKS